MPTPVVYQRHLYVLKNQGILACYDLRSGEQRYETRLQMESVGTVLIQSKGSSQGFETITPISSREFHSSRWRMP